MKATKTVNPATVGKPEFTARDLVVDRVRWDRLRERAGQRGLTVSSALLAAYAAVLGTWSRRGQFTVNVHTTVDPVSLVNPVRALMKEIDPALPVFDVRSIKDHIVNGRALFFHASFKRARNRCATSSSWRISISSDFWP